MINTTMIAIKIKCVFVILNRVFLVVGGGANSSIFLSSRSFIAEKRSNVPDISSALISSMAFVQMASAST